MSAGTNTLADRRKALVDRSDQQRAELTAIFGGIERKLSVVETVVAAARRVHRHRLLVGAGGVFLILAPLAARSWMRRILWLFPLALEGFRVARAFAESRRASSTANAPGVEP
jgi:UDP-N-acetyl-D-mannosaminuronic acid transferase (WecB/TagA/CpsF family)